MCMEESRDSKLLQVWPLSWSKANRHRQALSALLPPSKELCGLMDCKDSLLLPSPPIIYSPILWYWHSPLYCIMQKHEGTVKEHRAGCEACAWVPAPWPASVVVSGDLWEPLSNPPGPQFRPRMSAWQQVVVIQARSAQRSKASFGVSVSGTKWCCLGGVFQLCVTVQNHRLISGLLMDGRQVPSAISHHLPEPSSAPSWPWGELGSREEKSAKLQTTGSMFHE